MTLPGRWGQFLLTVIALVTSALAFIRNNDLRELREADARNSQAVQELRAELKQYNEQLYLLREEAAKSNVILGRVERLLK